MKLALKKFTKVLIGIALVTTSLGTFASDNFSFNADTKQTNQYLSVPDIGGTGVGLLNQQKEELIGEKILRQVRQQLPLLHDVWLEEETLKLFNNIYSQTNLGKPLAVVVVNDSQINAFAVPGGLFAINTGLFTSSRNMDEVAGVVAHEIAHVTQRHFSRSREAFKGQGLLSLAGLLAGLVVASQVPDAGAAVLLGSQAVLMDQQLIYSRNQEREADRVGMQYMSIAGYNPKSMADFFETMHRTTSQVSFLPDFWLTHPLSSERMSEARLRARQYPVNQQPNTEQQDLFEMMRWRAAVLSGVATVNQLKTLAPRNSAAALALATHYIKQSEFKEAKAILDGLTPNNIQKPLYLLIESDWYKAQGLYQKALDVLMPSYLIMPESKVFALEISDLYILLNNQHSAFKILNDLSQRYPRDIKVWALLQRAEIIKNNEFSPINVLRYKAEYQFWQGAESDAMISLLHASRLAKKINNQSLQEKIEYRLKQMQDTRELKL